MTELYIIIASVTWAHLTGIPQRFKWAFKKKSIKPFDCELCLSFWGVGLHSYFLAHEAVWFAICKGLVAGFIAVLIYHLLRLIKII